MICTDTTAAPGDCDLILPHNQEVTLRTERRQARGGQEERMVPAAVLFSLCYKWLCFPGLRFFTSWLANQAGASLGERILAY